MNLVLSLPTRVTVKILDETNKCLWFQTYDFFDAFCIEEILDLAALDSQESGRAGIGKYKIQIEFGSEMEERRNE